MNGEVLRDFRGSFAAYADQVLEAVSMATGRTKQDIVRDIVHEWADKKLHESNLIARLAVRDGKPRQGSAHDPPTVL